MSSALGINKKQEADRTVVALTGELNTATSKELAKELAGIRCSTLVLDFAQLRYITSAGVRVLLSKKQDMTDENGDLYIINANDEIRGIFDMIGLIGEFFRS